MIAREMHDIWKQYIVHRRNTREIARQFKLKECEVDSIISRCLNAQYSGAPMPFEQRTA